MLLITYKDPEKIFVFKENGLVFDEVFSEF